MKIKIFIHTILKQMHNTITVKTLCIRISSEAVYNKYTTFLNLHRMSNNNCCCSCIKDNPNWHVESMDGTEVAQKISRLEFTEWWISQQVPLLARVGWPRAASCYCVWHCDGDSKDTDTSSGLYACPCAS